MRYLNYFSCFYLLNNFMKLDRVVSKHPVYLDCVFKIEINLPCMPIHYVGLLLILSRSSQIVSLVVFVCLFQNQCN